MHNAIMYIGKCFKVNFLNQVFLKLFCLGSQYACLCVYTAPVSVCLPPRLLITSGMSGTIWTLYDWFKKFYSFYMAAVVDIVSRHSLSNLALIHIENQ